MKRENFDKNYKNIENEIIRQFQAENIQDFICIINHDTTKLLKLLNDNKVGKTLIPNLSMGELTLCANEWIGYTSISQTACVVENTNITMKNILRCEDFLDATISEFFSSIVLVPPIRQQTTYGRSAVEYMEKCLNLLAPGGRLVAVVPQNVTTAPAFKSLREKLISEYNLKGVISIKKISRAIGLDCSIIIVENNSQEDMVYMTLGENNVETIYDNFKNGLGNFFVKFEDVYDRIDPNFYDPKYKKVRELIRNRDTVKLHEIADVFNGIMIPSYERKDSGDYLIIKPQNIFDRGVHFSNEMRVYCSKEFVYSNNRGSKCILKNGDIVISMINKIHWAIYTGDDDSAIVNQNIAIIHGRKDTASWVKLFFNTNTGISYFESQLKFFSHCGTFRHISIRNLIDMVVPDIKMMKITDKVQNAIDIEAKVGELFRNIGWNVEENYNCGRFIFDLALLFNGELKAVVEIKTYKADEIRNNHRFVAQLESIKRKIGDASVLIFIDNNIYEYANGVLEQLAELPRPEKYRTEENKILSKKIHTREIFPIEQNSPEETCLTDSLLLELATRGEEIIAQLNRIEGKVDNISEKIETLSKQITGYQSLVDRQLDMAFSPEEEEHIIHAFSEECAERIINEVNANEIDKDYNKELQKLILSFGDSAWNKMDDSSKTFLVTSKVMFNNLVVLHDIVDYSGVCVLVTKALEVELNKRFCKKFLIFLKKKYPGKVNFTQFPTSLLDGYGKPIRPKHFTLGSVAYVLCYLKNNNLTNEQNENNKNKLLEYTREKLLLGKSDDEIMKILSDYAESVEQVKNDYRNPSAHTNELRRVDAEQCFALVLDVEKLLKCMLDSFDE